MDANRCPYLHVLLFRCEQCNGPLPVPVMSEAANLEKIDGDIFGVECRCGWLQNMFGAEAAMHWVALWDDARQLPDSKPPSRDGAASQEL